MKFTKWIAVFMSVVLLCGVLSACSAKGFTVPSVNDVESVQVRNGESAFSNGDAEWLKTTLEALAKSEESGMESTEEVPAVENAIKVDLILKSGGMTTYYLYADANVWLVEQPKQGIRRADLTFLDNILAMQ